MLKRQEMGEKKFEPAQVENTIRVLTAAHPDRPGSTWDLLRSMLADGTKSLDRRLGESGRLFNGERVEQEEQPLPDGPITAGIDGGYVRAAHKEGLFEVIAGRSVVAFRRAAKACRPLARAR